jgi:hypothetical protein
MGLCANLLQWGRKFFTGKSGARHLSQSIRVQAILSFTGGQGEEGETIAELFSFEKELTAVFASVPRTSINGAIRNEQRFQMASGMTDPDTIAALGKQLGAEYVVAGGLFPVRWINPSLPCREPLPWFWTTT